MKRSFIISIIISIIIIFTFGSSFATWEYMKLMDGTDAAAADDSLLLNNGWDEDDAGIYRVVVIARDIAFGSSDNPVISFVQYRDGYETNINFMENGSSWVDTMDVSVGDKYSHCRLGMHSGALGGQDQIVLGDSLMIKYDQHKTTAGKLYIYLWRKKVY